MQAVLVDRRQFLEVGAVFAEAFGHADIGVEQGGVEGPVQGFDVGVAPLAVVIAQALAAELEDLAGVGRKAAVADPEFAQCQVVLLGLTVIVGWFAWVSSPACCRVSVSIISVAVTAWPMA